MLARLCAWERVAERLDTCQEPPCLPWTQEWQRCRGCFRSLGDRAVTWL